VKNDEMPAPLSVAEATRHDPELGMIERKRTIPEPDALVKRAQLNTLPPGLYLIEEPLVRRKKYDPLMRENWELLQLESAKDTTVPHHE
jgi:hypothetical protein